MEQRRFPRKIFNRLIICPDILKYDVRILLLQFPLENLFDIFSLRLGLWGTRAAARVSGGGQRGREAGGDLPGRSPP